MNHRAPLSWSALVLSVAALAACNGDDGPRPLAAVAAVSSSQFTGSVGDLVSEPLVVKVTDDQGVSRGGVAVSFLVTDGGGSVSPAVDTTDNAGEASTRWRLGGTTGLQRVTATVAGVTNAATFTASATAGAPASVAVQAGDNQTAIAGSAVSVAPSVIVRDRFNNPVNGASVFFSVSSGGGSVTGVGATTNPLGIATVGSWTLGPAVGANRLTALVVSNGVTANPITFSANGTAGSAAAVTARSATALTATVGSLVTPLPQIRVVDASGNPVAGTTVTFTASNGSTVVNGSKTTDQAGLASPDGWQVGATAGTFTLTATVGTLTPIVFTVNARPGVAAVMTASAGNNQSAQVGRTLAVDPAVRITDALGNPIVGQEVLFEVLSGGGSAVSRRPVTDANGVATIGAWTLGDAPGTNTLRATAVGLTIAGSPVTFTATATPGSPATITVAAGNNQSAASGSLLLTAPSVVVRDARGNPVGGVTVSFTTGVNSGSVTSSSAVTNAAGIATAGSWRLGPIAGTQTITASVAGIADVMFTATATAGSASVVQVVGDTALASIPVNSFVAQSVLPQVKVMDANGNPISGAVVTFEVVNGFGNALTSATRTTAADGLAQLGAWKIGTAAGTYRVRALVGGIDLTGVEPTWYVTGLALAASNVANVTTASQAAVASTVVAATPVIRVTDQYGNGVAGVTVTFVTGGVGASTVNGAASQAVLTDVNGNAVASAWTMGVGAGARTLTATVTGAGITGNPVVFTATVP